MKHPHSVLRGGLALVLAAAVLFSAAAPQFSAARGSGPGLPVTTIYTNIPGELTANVPGYPGVHFGPGTGTTHFDRIFGSPNGNWILTADTDIANTSADEVLIANGVVKLFEGDPAPWTGGAENVGLLETRMGINDSGSWVLTNNTNGALEADEYVVFVSASDVYTTVAQEGTSAGAFVAGALWDEPLDSPVIASDDSVGFAADSLDGPLTTEDEILVLGDALLAQEGKTVPSGQVGSEFWENFDLADYWISNDGSRWLAQGDLTGSTSTDDVVVVDGAVVIQEGSVLPGSGFPNPVDLNGIVGVHMAPDGTWYARGNNAVSELDWVYSDGGVVAATGRPIFAGATEAWSDVEFSDCFFMHVGDSNGNYVIGGVSDGPTDSNGVLVLNFTTVIAREGDPLDLDNNGQLDDDAYFDTFGNDDAFLADDGMFYVVATVKDGTGTRIGQGVFSIDLSSLFQGPVIYLPVVRRD